MSTPTRKQREVSQREALILDTARRMLAEDGYLKLNMAKVAEAIEYSKGTVYQHFGSKEDLIVALAIETAELRNRYFERAAAFPGNSRERITALGVAYETFVRLNPDSCEISLICHSASILGKAERERQEALLLCEGRCMQMAAGVVRDAIAQGDLSPPSECSAEELSFSLWAQHFGTYRIMASGMPLARLGIPDPMEAVWRATQSLLDGIHWKPLSTEHDYRATADRIRRQIFPRESQRRAGSEKSRES